MSVTDSCHVGVFVRKTRKSLGVTQQELAMASGTGVRFIIELEQGKESCRLGLTLKVLQTLGATVTLSDALTMEEEDDYAAR